MLEGSGGEAAVAGWATRPARSTTSVTTTMRAIRPIASPPVQALATSLVRPTDQPIVCSTPSRRPLGRHSARQLFDEVQLLGQPAGRQVVLAHAAMGRLTHPPRWSRSVNRIWIPRPK